MQYEGIGESFGAGVSSFGRSCDCYFTKVVSQTMRTFYRDQINIFCCSQRVFAPALEFCEGSPESVQATVKELEENLKEGIANAVGSSLTKLSQAKVVGIACDVCEANDVQRLANFAVSELGYIDIWVSVAVLC